MAYLPSLPAAAVLDVIRACPQPALPPLDHHQALLRRRLPLAAAERELIATGERTKLSPFRDAVNTRLSSSPFGAPAGDGSEPKPRRGRYSNRCLSGRDKRHLSQRTSA